MPTWTEICSDKSLQDLPFEIETNGQGQIIMSPHKARHSRFQIAVQKLLLEHLPDGEPIPELAVQTDDGVRVVDVGWATQDHIREEGDNPAFIKAPAICIEILSADNSDQEMAHKRDLYFAKGATEVWHCAEQGDLTFFGLDGQLQRSQLIPAFPTHVALP